MKKVNDTPASPTVENKGGCMSMIQEQADIQRAEAKRLLNLAFGWGENIASETVNRAVDCTIGAALLEITATMHQENMKVLLGNTRSRFTARRGR